MAFNSMAFLFGLLPAVLVCYFLLPARWRTGRNWVLLVFSLAFYAWGGVRMVPERELMNMPLARNDRIFAQRHFEGKA